MIRRYEGIRGSRGVSVAVTEDGKTIAITGPFRTWADAEQWEREQIGEHMTTTLVDLPTLRGLAKLAREHGTSAQFMDMALDFAAAAELHIAHLEQLLSDQCIVCSCESMLLIDFKCLLHGYSADPRYCNNYEQNLNLETEQTCVHCGEMEVFHPVELRKDPNGEWISLSHFGQLYPPSDDS